MQIPLRSLNIRVCHRFTRAAIRSGAKKKAKNGSWGKMKILRALSADAGFSVLGCLGAWRGAESQPVVLNSTGITRECPSGTTPNKTFQVMLAPKEPRVKRA